MQNINYYKLAVALVLPQLAGLIGTIFTNPNIDGWYRTLNQPALSPPDWTFGVVWPLLFSFMGVAFYIVWSRGTEKPGVRLAMRIFLFQLFLNVIWSWLFFGLQNPMAALWEIMALWVAILATILAFYRPSAIAAGLLVPYLLWVSFAFYLNYQIVALN